MLTLNEQQEKIVTNEFSNQLVIAGAGSGKTRVIISRMRYLLEEKSVQSFQILGVTFTNKVAHEMSARIIEGLSIQASDLWIGTFHGIANRLLKIHSAAVNLPADFQVLDQDDQLRLVKQTLKEKGIDDNKYPPRQVQYYINQKKEVGIRASTLIETHFPEKMFAELYEIYEKKCERLGVVDFSELLLRSVELFRDNPDILQRYQERFLHIFVDEFQDINDLQYEWLSLLGKTTHNFVTAVGDDDQSIYSWRGASIEHIHNFQKDFKEVSVFRLEQNYRSTTPILTSANYLIDHNSNRLGKSLWTDNKEGEPITVFAAYDERSEGNFIVSRIQEWISSGGLYNEVAIFYRSNAQSRALEESLGSMIPYRIYGGLRFFDRLEIKNTIAYLSLLVNLENNLAFERILNVPTRGIGDRTLQKLKEVADLMGMSLWKTAKEHSANLGRSASKVLDFVTLIDNLKNQLENLPLNEMIEMILNETGLLEFHSKDHYGNGMIRKENLQELVNASSNFYETYVATNQEASYAQVASAFLDHVVLDYSEVSKHNDSVQLMTLHSAKGLEFPLVFIVGCEEDLLPHYMSMQENNLEEERRLFYVGMTRAMKQLFLSYANVRYLYGKQKHMKPSRFLSELPEEFLQEGKNSARRAQSRTLSEEASLFQDKQSFGKSSASQTSDGLAVGSKVQHAKFGRGRVTLIEGSGSSTRVQVQFEASGVKWLIAQFANLEKV